MNKNSDIFFFWPTTRIQIVEVIGREEEATLHLAKNNQAFYVQITSIKLKFQR